LAAKSIFGCSRAIQRMKIKITIARMELEYKYELSKYKKNERSYSDVSYAQKL